MSADYVSRYVCKRQLVVCWIVLLLSLTLISDLGSVLVIRIILCEALYRNQYVL